MNHSLWNFVTWIMSTQLCKVTNQPCILDLLVLNIVLGIFNKCSIGHVYLFSPSKGKKCLHFFSDISRVKYFSPGAMNDFWDDQISNKMNKICSATETHLAPNWQRTRTRCGVPWFDDVHDIHKIPSEKNINEIRIFFKYNPKKYPKHLPHCWNTCGQ